MDVREQINIGSITCSLISAGTLWADGGAAMGVLPQTIWRKFLETDNKNRIKLALNLLLMQTSKENILVDTGVGNKITPKIRKIYNPSNFELLENLSKKGLKKEDIHVVILTHLHFDHAGGITSIFKGEKKLTFPNALHIIQKKEWETAKNPDELNKASYNFKDDISLLEASNNYKLISGDYQLTPEIKLELVEGHSEGMQVVKIESENKLAYYAGDIIPLEAHKHLSVTSAYDINRKDTFEAKKKILQKLDLNNGILFLNHDIKKKIITF